jgi:hypothetical protein
VRPQAPFSRVQVSGVPRVHNRNKSVYEGDYRVAASELVHAPGVAVAYKSHNSGFEGAGSCCKDQLRCLGQSFKIDRDHVVDASRQLCNSGRRETFVPPAHELDAALK